MAACTPEDFLSTVARVARVGSRPAALEPGLRALERVLRADPRLVHARDDADRTALHLAAEEGNWPLARLLLEHGAEAGARDRFGNAPLHLLMSRSVGSPPSPPPPRRPETPRGERDFEHPLWSAPSQRSLEEFVRDLVSAGADLEAQDSRGRTPLGVALAEGLPEMQRLLRSLGAREPAPRKPSFSTEDDLLEMLSRGDPEALRLVPLERLAASPALARRTRVLGALLAPLFLDGQREKADLVLDWFVKAEDPDGLCAAGDRLADRGDPALVEWFMEAVVRRAWEEDRPDLLEPWGLEVLPRVEALWASHPERSGAEGRAWGDFLADSGIPWADLRRWLAAGRPLSLLACHALVRYSGIGPPSGWDRPGIEEVGDAFSVGDAAPVFARARHVSGHLARPPQSVSPPKATP